MFRRLTLALVALLAWSTVSVTACPPPDLTLRQQAASATLVLFGTLANPAMNPVGDERTAVTDLRIESVVKPGKGLPEGKVITLPRYMPIKGQQSTRMIVFFRVFRGQLDPWGSSVESDAPAKYLRDGLKLDPKKPADAVLFFSRHLDSPDPVVNNDAFLELSSLPYADLREGAARLSPEAIAGRLVKPGRAPWERGLDAVLLGHCGKDRHAVLLLKLINTARKSADSPRLHELLIGHALLKPKEGLAIIREVIQQKNADFNTRYYALRAVRFFASDRPDVYPRAQVVQSLLPMLDQLDIADLAVEELRRLGEESVMDRVLALPGRPSFDPSVVRRAVLRYVVTFPTNAKARAYLEQRLALDPEEVENAEEALRLEAEAKKKGE